MPESIELNLHLYGGFPHSEISGSKVARTSPKLIAACHVFHRLLQPRHSPNALLTLDLLKKPIRGEEHAERALYRDRLPASRVHAWNDWLDD